jgi:hypothetical protein
MHSLQLDDFSIEFPSGFWCSSFLCYPNTHKVFRRLCLLLNASNWVLQARNACSFEARLRSLELSFSGQQCLQVIRGWASVPRIIFFGPAVPSSYSRLGFGSSNCLFWASSAFKLFEAGLWSLELSFSGQQCLQVIQGWASVPRIVFFGPAVPSKCSSLNYGPSKHIPRPPASSFCSRMG